MAQASMLDAFLREILASVRLRDGHRITDLIQLDFENISPERQKPYSDLNIELNAQFPPSNTNIPSSSTGFRGGFGKVDDDAELSKRCKDALPASELGSFHAAFSESIVQYFRYLRDFTTADNQAKALEIRQLTSQCITALGDTKYGVIMIPIVLSFSRVLARIAANLDRDPTLLEKTGAAATAAAAVAATNADEPGGNKVSFVESTANVLRDAFIKCLAGSPGSARAQRPTAQDKRIGIYLTANSCFKLLWQCRKLRNAQQMFLSIDAQSPPLSFYPAAQRVTYLYYLGRYHFANNHFYRAQIALQSAYDQCHRQAVKHRRLILTYLVSSNICLGRFPNAQLWARADVSEIAQYFVPLCGLIKAGDLGGVQSYLDPSVPGGPAHWFLRKRVLLQLRDRCEVLVWWSLIRKVFIISGYQGEDKKIPFLRLNYVRWAARWSVQKAFAQSNAYQASSMLGQQIMSHHQPLPYVDDEFAGADDAISETGFDLVTGSYHDRSAGQHTTLFEQLSDEEESPTMYEVESVFMSLIQQNLLRGFVLHNPTNPRFAIPGSQAAGGPVLKGFPRVWHTVQANATQSDVEVVPGWVKDDILTGDAMRAGASGLGGVVRLSGARPVGVGS